MREREEGGRGGEGNKNGRTPKKAKLKVSWFER